MDYRDLHMLTSLSLSHHNVDGLAGTGNNTWCHGPTRECDEWASPHFHELSSKLHGLLHGAGCCYPYIRRMNFRLTRPS